MQDPGPLNFLDYTFSSDTTVTGRGNNLLLMSFLMVDTTRRTEAAARNQ